MKYHGSQVELAYRNKSEKMTKTSNNCYWIELAGVHIHHAPDRKCSYQEKNRALT